MQDGLPAPMAIHLLFKIITKEFLHGNGSTAQQVRLAASRPRSDNKVAERKQLFEVLPRVDLVKRVQTEDEKIAVFTSTTTPAIAGVIIKTSAKPYPLRIPP
jgi:hypothetical protein